MTYQLWNKTPLFDEQIKQEEPFITPYLLGGENNPCVVVCPGGAYACKSYENEGYNVAEWLNKIGFSAFVLEYRVAPYIAPVPLLDLQRAIKYVRYNSKQFKINKNIVGAIGFSAGGHLVSSAITHLEPIMTIDEVDNEDCRPTFGILCYPVISTDESFGHMGSIINLLGEDYSADLADYYSSEKQVTEHTPPCFIWHTTTDECVPVKNSVEFANALQNENIPHELHLFYGGWHGLGLAADFEGSANNWTVLCEKWLNFMFGGK